MNKRMRKKRADEIVAVALSLPLTLRHARPSLWKLQRGTIRHYVYRQMVEKLGVTPRPAKHAAWRWFSRSPAPEGTP